jgi:hypothetical protein
MIFLYAVGLGIALGYALGGRLSRLASMELRQLWFVLLALGIQLLIFPLFSAKPLLPRGTAILHGVSYGLVFLWLVLNWRVRPLLVIGGGAIANIVAVSANGGYMPASADALRQTGHATVADILAHGEVYGNLVGVSGTTHMNFLGDWVPLPRWLPFTTAMSAGDVLIVVGLVWLLAGGMRARG